MLSEEAEYGEEKEPIGRGARFRGPDVEAWIEQFAGVALVSARLAADYLDAVRTLVDTWRDRLAKSSKAPRSDAAAWAVIEQLPAHPIITAPVAAAAVRRSKPQIYQALRMLEEAGVLIPISKGLRNRAWEAEGLLDLLAGLEAGDRPL